MDAFAIEVLRYFLRRLKKIDAINIETGEKKEAESKPHEKNPEAPRSPIHINLRAAADKEGPLTEEDLQSIAGFFWLYIHAAKISFAGIAGIPRAGNLIAKAMQAHVYEERGDYYPRLTLQKEEREGRGRIGRLLSTESLPRGEKVLLVEDLITKADLTEEAVECLRDQKYVVTDALVFLDCERGGFKKLQRMGVKLHSIITIGAMLDFYRREGLIKREAYEAVKEYLARGS
jgi:orotate phosphoribosyltransferase